MTIKQILLKMRRYIARYGWRQSTLGFKGEAVCLRGALNMVLVGDPQKWGRDRARYSVEGRLMKACPDIARVGIVAWNNRIATSKEDVIEVLKKAEKL